MQLGGRYLNEGDLKDAGFQKLGKNVQIHTRASIYGVENISIGNNVRIDDFVVIIATGKLELGNYICIHNHCFLGSKFGIVLKDFSTLACGAKVYSSSSDFSGDKFTGVAVPPELRGGDRGKVILEKYAIIGAGSIVMPNCIIAEGCSVGALSLVKKSLEPWGIYAGIPARRIKDRKKDLLKLEKLTCTQSKCGE